MHKSAKILTKENIMANTRREGDCIVWTGARTKTGYGQCGWRVRGVHRLSYQLFCGPIPKGMNVCHRCDNPPCINPEHLFLGTQVDNLNDMIAKGRSMSGKRAVALTDEQVSALRAETGKTLAELSAQYGISRSAIHNIRSNRRRKL